jgi:hypothetical protein
MHRFSIEHAWHASPQSPIGVSWRAASRNPEIVVEVSADFAYYRAVLVKVGRWCTEDSMSLPLRNRWIVLNSDYLQLIIVVSSVPVS